MGRIIFIVLLAAIGWYTYSSGLLSGLTKGSAPQTAKDSLQKPDEQQSAKTGFHAAAGTYAGSYTTGE
jgi:hypothetical protein